MTVRKLRYGADPSLREAARQVNRINGRVERLLRDMAETMYYHLGIGLAAPQIGIARRVIVADVGGGLVELINPEWVSLAPDSLAQEGCLSLPGIRGLVPRAMAGRVKGFDRRGVVVTMDAEGLLARCLQHEIDHLNGILITDRFVAQPEPTLASVQTETRFCSNVERSEGEVSV